MRIMAALLAAVSAGMLPSPSIGKAASLSPAHASVLRAASDPSKPLFTVGISGGFTGARMRAQVYVTGEVRTLREGANSPKTVAETRVPLSRGAVQAVLDAAARTRVFTISRSVQDRTFGADIPVLSFAVATNSGVRSVHIMGTEGSHPAGSGAFFPIWGLLYALAGYPSQIR